jgi:hypothetical protein
MKQHKTNSNAHMSQMILTTISKGIEKNFSIKKTEINIFILCHTFSRPENIKGKHTFTNISYSIHFLDKRPLDIVVSNSLLMKAFKLIFNVASFCDLLQIEF